MDTKETTEPIDEATAVELRKAGLPVSEGVTEAEAYRAYGIQANAQMRKASKANEKKLKGFYVDFLFEKLNLTKYR